MKSEAKAAVEQAHRTLRGARILFEEGLPDMAASEAYYAMFHGATAALGELGQSHSKHSAVIAAFGREFARTEILPPALHKHLREAFAMRQRATYDYQVEIPTSEAELLLDQAARFIATVEEHLTNSSEDQCGSGDYDGA